MDKKSRLDLIDCIKAEPLELFNGADVTDGLHYAYWHGDGKMLLQAHVDTVYPASHVVVKSNVISGDGLGADDRAGIYACRCLKVMHPNTPILFTNFEETGGVGMKAALAEIEPLLRKVNMAIAIDRQGMGEYVTYNHLPKQCREYVESFGWQESMGTFSDIMIFSRELRIPSVNVSCGYYHQHSKREVLVIDALMASIGRLGKMLRNPIAHLHELPEVATKGFDSYYDRWSERNDYNVLDYVDKCPFCGGEDLWFEDRLASALVCQDCGEVFGEQDLYAACR